MYYIAALTIRSIIYIENIHGVTQFTYRVACELCLRVIVWKGLYYDPPPPPQIGVARSAVELLRNLEGVSQYLINVVVAIQAVISTFSF